MTSSVPSWNINTSAQAEIPCLTSYVNYIASMTELAKFLLAQKKSCRDSM